MKLHTDQLNPQINYLTEPSAILNQLLNSLQERFNVLLKIDRYTKEKSQQYIRRNIKHVLYQLDLQNHRQDIEQKALQTLIGQPNFTRKLKLWFTQFSFAAIRKLEPSMKIQFDQNYINVPKLYAQFFENVKQQESLKQVLELKSANTTFKIQVYISFVRILLNYVRTIFIKKLKSMNDTLNQLIQKKKIQKKIPPRKLQSQHNIQIHKLSNTKFTNQFYVKQQTLIFTKLPCLKTRLSIEKSKDQTNITQIQQRFKSQTIEVQGKKQKFNEGIRQVIRIPTSPDIALNKKKSSKRFDKNRFTRSPEQKISIYNETTTLRLKLSTQFQMNNITVEYQYMNRTGRNSCWYSQFLDLFYANIEKMYRKTDIVDLEYDHLIRRERRQKGKLRQEKLSWICENIGKVMNFILFKNYEISKEISTYSNNYSNWYMRAMGSS